MRPQARLQAAIDILDDVIAAARDNGPAADTVIARYFKTRRYAGSKDRRAIRDLVYDAIRAFAAAPPGGRAAMLGLARETPALAALFDGSPHAPAPVGDAETGATAGDLPQWLRDRFPAWFDAREHAALLSRAPLDLRVNTLKAAIADVAQEIPGAIAVDGLPGALRLPAGTRIEDQAAYREGRVEIQDAGSQIIVAACAARPGETVIDLCAGGGGKTLALAAAMQDRGRLIACDAIRARMGPLAERAARAGARVETRLLDMKREAESLTDLAGAADLVVVDAPCSGTGTWRRNPEGRWRISRDRIARLVAEQARLLDVATTLVRPGGRIVYAVCSLVESEGPHQIEAFLSRHSDWAVHDAGAAGRAAEPGRVLTPAHDGCDGFFFAALMRNGSHA